jgi:monoamine oxidase
MKKTNSIIIGAGASGLMAAYTLAKAGKSVTILEARNRIGGRIHTLNNTEGFKHAELGAEFIHGNLPVTFSLLQEAGIAVDPVDFTMWHYTGGRLVQNSEFVEHWDIFLEKLNSLKEDMTMENFLDENFGGENYAPMRQQITSYIAGYDTADVKDASAFALREEWNNEDESAQHRIRGGYAALVAFLERECNRLGVEMHLNSTVQKLEWASGYATITTCTATYSGDKAIVALPLGVLQAPEDAAGAITFVPDIALQKKAFSRIGFGSVIKILLEFERPFWNDTHFKQQAVNPSPGIGFLFTNAQIPTFWTQAPLKSPLLTGWLGGPPAFENKNTADSVILETALQSLGPLFNIALDLLRKQVKAYKIINWTNEPYTRGSYAYDKPESTSARTLLATPIEDTIYFTGEYMYSGPAIGTVEAALTSGKDVAQHILKSL